MKRRKLIATVTALILILSLSVPAFAASSEIKESISFINEHKDMISFYHSLRYEKVTEKLASSDISDEERQQLNDYILLLKDKLEDCLEGEHTYLIAIPDTAGPLDCTSLGVCEYCEHSEIILTGDGYRERHRDNDENGICDDCKRVMPHIGCEHFCHSESFVVQKLLLPLFRIIWSYFGIEEYCSCGTYHFN